MAEAPAWQYALLVRHNVLVEIMLRHDKGPDIPKSWEPAVLAKRIDQRVLEMAQAKPEAGKAEPPPPAPPSVLALDFTAEEFANLGTVKVYTDKGKQRDSFSVSAKTDSGSVHLQFMRCDSAAIAEDNLETRRASEIRQRVHTPAPPMPPDIGVASTSFWASSGGKPFAQLVTLVRHNVWVLITLDRGRMQDAETLARRLDQRILAMATRVTDNTAAATVKVKVPGVLAAVDFAASDFEDLGPIKVWEGAKNAKDYFTFYLPPDKGDGRPDKALLTVVVSRLKTPAVAAAIMAAVPETPRAGRLAMATGGPLADVGDACGFRLGEVQSIRNNVHVLLIDESGGTVDVVAFAKRIDKLLLQRLVPTTVTNPAR
jgi:hypothetical protein